MGAGATRLTYNGVTIFNCETREFSEESILDDSGTDQIYHRYRLTVIGYVHGGLAGKSAGEIYLGIFPNPANQDAAAHHKDIKAALMAPRGHLIYRLGDNGSNNGTILLEARAFSTTEQNILALDHKNRDVSNGPHPKNFNILQICGNNILKVSFTVECCLIHCGADDSSLQIRPPVLNNRWSCTDSIDGNYFTTRTWRGLLKLATAQVNPHNFRGYVVPKVAPGFRRQSMDFTASPDGLTLAYTVIDQEVNNAPPPPATDWRITHTESVTANNAATAMGSVTVEMWGDRTANKRELLAVAFAAADQYLDFLKQNVNAQDKAHILSIAVTSRDGSVGENYISLRIEIIHRQGAHDVDDKDPNAVAQVLNLQLANWGSVPARDSIVNGYDPDLSRGAGANDFTELEGPARAAGAFAAHLQSICDPDYSFLSALPVDENMVAEDSPPQPNISARVSPTVSALEPDWMSDSHKEHLYVSWEMDTLYDEQENTVGLPYADASLFDRTSGSGSPTLAVIHLSAPTSIRIVKVKGERIGAPPEMPKAPTSFTDANNVTFTRKWVGNKILTTARGPGDIDIYTQQAEFHYWMDRPLKDFEDKRVGYNPWSTLGLENSPEAAYVIEEF